MAFKTVGKRKPKYEGVAHVTGESKFVDDIFVPRTLTVKAFRSPVHKGVITSYSIHYTKLYDPAQAASV